ncbi:MAG: phosphatidylserine decarboxylase [Verrucomicrobiota bacterium]|jgi:phosphatidylserine decarboxylase
MKHEGIARRAAIKLIVATLLVAVGLGVAGLVFVLIGLLAHFIAWILLALAIFLGMVWVLFAVFTIYFFRDPTARTPTAPNLVVSPGHGKVDAIEEITETQFMDGPCHRISTFLSVINVHVQNAPVAGKVALLQHAGGEFLSALKAESGLRNENVLVGFESTESPGEKIGVRLIAGVLARRIVPFVALGDETRRGDRMSLIQFGSRCDLYLPLHYRIQVKLGDKVVGGETVMASKS